MVRFQINQIYQGSKYARVTQGCLKNTASHMLDRIPNVTQVLNMAGF